MRSPGGLLAALRLFKALDARVSLNEVMTFLYVCENEGLTVQELATIAGFTQSTASRSLRVLGMAGTGWALPPALGLVTAFLHPEDNRRHVIHLTEQGAALRQRLNHLIPRSGPAVLDRDALAGAAA